MWTLHSQWIKRYVMPCNLIMNLSLVIKRELRGFERWGIDLGFSTELWSEWTFEHVVFFTVSQPHRAEIFQSKGLVWQKHSISSFSPSLDSCIYSFHAACGTGFVVVSWCFIYAVCHCVILCLVEVMELWSPSAVWIREERQTEDSVSLHQPAAFSFESTFCELVLERISHLML